jgi:hypothetical protein
VLRKITLKIKVVEGLAQANLDMTREPKKQLVG